MIQTNHQAPQPAGARRRRRAADADGRRPRGARAGRGTAGPRHRSRRSGIRRRRHVRDHVRLGHPRHPARLDARRRQGITRSARRLLEFVRSRNDKIPIFLMAERGEASSIPIDVMEMVDEYIWTLEDTAAFVGGRVAAAMRRYLEVMLPPLAAALMKFSQDYEYSWHTPGHTGGTAFLKSPVGRIFFDYFGENLLRSDLSISVGSLGSLLDHTGPIGEHEKYAARVFGAHRTYCVTNGTSTSNRVIFMAAVGARPDRAVRSQLPQVDRARPGDDAAASRPISCRCATATGSSARSRRSGSRRPRSRRRSRRTRWSTNGVETRAGVLGRHELHLRRPLLQRAARRGAARPERRSDPLRRGLVRLRALQSALPRPPRDARRPEGPHRARRSSRRTPRTSCSRRCRRRRSCTSATAAARFRTQRFNESFMMHALDVAALSRSSCRTTSRPR